jgi:hypothetical protein
MARMTDSESVAANTTTGNVLAGKLHEFLNENSIVRLLATSSATGINATFLVGGESICQDQIISLANRFPIFPDDMVVEGAGFASDRLFYFLRNTTGGALTVISAVDVYPA